MKHAAFPEMPHTNLEVAKALAAQGFHIFPCREQAFGGAPAKTPYPYVLWRSQSTTSLDKIEEWWGKWPGALPGVDLHKSGHLVIDADRHGGPDGVSAWHELTADWGIITPHVETPGNGLHFYFRQPDGERLGNKEGLIKGRGINVRGSGGYVIGPGAIMPDGRTYRQHGDLNSACVLPEKLASMLRDKDTVVQLPAERVQKPIPKLVRKDTAPPEPYLQKAIGEELEKVASAAKGSSNNALNEAAFALGTMVGAGWISRVHAQSMLEQTAWGNAAIKKDGRWPMLATIRSGLEAGIKNPRPMPESRDISALADEGAEIAKALTESVAELGDTGGAEPVKEHQIAEFPDHLTRPGGFIEEMTDWIEATARYPSRAIALATALSVLGTAMGREWSGPTDSSTVLYTLILAPTGGGKDHAIEQASRLMSRAGMQDLIGPDDFQSANAMASLVQRKPLSLCIMDEFGAFLSRITDRKASTFARDSSAFLRKMWSVKFKMWRSSEYAQKASVTVWGPSFNIMGVSVPKEFYAALRGADVANGFFNRFFVVSVNQKPAEREPLLPPAEVPDSITRKLSFAMTRGRKLDLKRAAEHEVVPTPVRWGEGGQEADAELKQEIECRVEADEDARDFYSRTREMAIRLATIAGFGRDMAMPVIDGHTMAWASRVALYSTEQMHAQYKEYAAENDAQALAKEIMRHVKVVCKSQKRCPHSMLLKRLDNKYRVNEIKGAIELLVMAEDLKMEKVEPAGKRGRPGLYYRL